MTFPLRRDRILQKTHDFEGNMDKIELKEKFPNYMRRLKIVQRNVLASYMARFGLGMEINPINPCSL
jgi:hypothetical protein